MTDEFRAMCAELLAIIPASGTGNPHSLVVARARALLAEPVAEGPTDEALANFTAWFCRNYPGPNTLIHRPEWHAPKVFRAASDAIDRWGRHPAPPAEGEVAELVNMLTGIAYWKRHGKPGKDDPSPFDIRQADRLTHAADLLAQRHPAPVPLSERLPGPDDCDAEGKCWWFNPGEPAMSNPHIATSSWRLCRMINGKPRGTHFLPAHALPFYKDVIE